MDYNPFTKRCSLLERQVQSMEAEVGECSRQLDWYSSFDPEVAATAVASRNREAGRIKWKVVELKAKRTSEAECERGLAHDARLSLDPRRWFSEERRAFAKLRDEARARLRLLDADIAAREIKADKALQAAHWHQTNLERYRTLDLLALAAQRNALELQLGQQRPELEKLLAEKQRVDALLSPLLQEQRHLNDQVASLEQELKQAEDLRRRLNEAYDARGRAEVHAECGDTFKGVSNPTQVVHGKQREIRVVQRNLEKIELRLNRIAGLASRTISTLVIDGNNLCYEGREFVGLEPLLALTYALVGAYRVVVVFDASIRRRLQMNDQQVARDFPPEAIVHVVASRQAADETVLETASGSDEYVISNDRFKDYTDQPAVSGQRLIRHEIVAGKVLIHDLNLTVEYGKADHVRAELSR